MYFPYLRGRQFELLALRELAEGGLIGEKVIPIIEPIKPSSTLVKTVEQYIEANKYIAMIHNPQVGSFSQGFKTLKDSFIKNSLLDLFGKCKVINSHIMNANSAKELTSLRSKEINVEDLLVINNNSDFTDTYLEIFNEERPRYILVPDDIVFRRKVKGNRILLADRFHRQVRNADYLDVKDSPFSEDHLYYKSEGYSGFSDYSIAGEKFSEAGFAPYAVAIHIVYFDEQNSLRVKHFVSDSNDDYNDPAGKFYEALQKLNAWQSTANLTTYGIKQFINHYQKGTYPGLGTVKKLSIMHHIELVSNYLDEVENDDML